MPPHWSPEPALLDAVLAGLDNNPFVTPVTLDGLFDRVPLEQQRRSAPVVRELAPVNPAAADREPRALPGDAGPHERVQEHRARQ